MIEQNKETRANQLLHLSWKLQKQMRHLVRNTALQNGLTIPQYSILMMMGRHDHITQKKLRKKTLLPKSTLSKAIDELVKQGLLVRKQIEDNRREVELFVSDQGRKFIQNIFSQENSVYYLFNQAVESLSDDEFNQLLNVHEQMIIFLQKQGNDKL